MQEISAPVQLQYSYTDEQLAFLLKHSNDAFNRWDAGNRLAINVLQEDVSEQKNTDESHSLTTLKDALKHALQPQATEASLLAELLILPNEKDLEERLEKIDMRICVLASESLQKDIAEHLEADLLKTYHAFSKNVAYQYNAEEMARRKLQNICLQLLNTLDNSEYKILALEQYNRASNMTEQVGAINALIHSESDQREQALTAFEKQWQHDGLVMDKWLAFQARSKVPGALDNVKALMQHSVFKITNPNKVRALIGAFAGQNAYHFHNPDGSGYEFIAQQVIALNEINPQVASRLVRTLMRWKSYVAPCGEKMREQLKMIAAHKNLSKDVYEIVTKSL